MATRSRFYGRPEADPLHAVIQGVVDGDGGGSMIDDLDRHFAQTAVSTPDAICVDAGVVTEQTYRAVVAALM